MAIINMNSFLRTIALALSSFPVLAYANLADGWYDNWLLGVSMGYADRNSVIQSSILDSNNLSGYSRESSDNGWLAAAFAGYQSIHNEWLLGVEFNLEWQNIANNIHQYAFSGRQVTAEYRRKGMLDLSGRLGYALTTNFMPYVRLGAEISRDALSSRFNGRSTPMVHLYNKGWIHRFLVGFGAEMPIPDIYGMSGMTVRLEYDFHSKGKTIQDYGATGEADSMITYSTGMQPRTYSGRLSFVWNYFEY